MNDRQTDSHISESSEEHQRFVLRNRMLLYLHGMELGALPGMELASEILRQAGSDASSEKVFDAMQKRLREQGVSFPNAFSPESGLRCFPPLNRRPMLSAPMERLTILEMARKFAVGVLGFVTLRYILWDRR